MSFTRKSLLRTSSISMMFCGPHHKRGSQGIWRCPYDPSGRCEACTWKQVTQRMCICAVKDINMENLVSDGKPWWNADATRCKIQSQCMYNYENYESTNVWGRVVHRPSILATIHCRQRIPAVHSQECQPELGMDDENIQTKTFGAPWLWSHEKIKL